MFQIQVLGIVDDGYTSAEVYYGDALVAVVYELPDGWRSDLFESPRGLPLPELVAALQSAQTRLSVYVNRKGENPPDGLTREGMSLWLLEEADGSAMGIRLR